MPSIYDLKPRFQQLLRPLLAPLVKWGITPNLVTLAALLGSAAVGSLFYLQRARPFWLLLPVWLVVRMGLNALDGMLAREHHQETRLGAVLNELGDVLSDILLYVPLGAVYPPAQAAVCCFAALAALTEFCGVLGRAVGGTRRYDGPMGKSDRAALVGVTVLLTWVVRPLRYAWPGIFWVASLLAGATCYKRLQGTLRGASAMTESQLIWKLAQVVLGVLVVASGVTYILGQVKPDMKLGEVRARINAWWIMAPLIFVGVAVNQHLSTLFFCVLSAVAFREYVNLLPVRQADHTALTLCFLAIAIQYYWIQSGWFMMFVLFVPVYVFLVIPMWLVLSREATGFVTSASELSWGMMAFVFGLSHLAFLVTMPAPAGSAVTGRAMVLFLIFVVEISDVLQFVWGKTLGRHKIIPTISPNKTWEGFLGGAASAVGLSLMLRFLTPFSVLETVLVGLLITVMGFFGGAVMSAVKRDFGVKDFGHLIPGHGGVLDRVDSLVYAAPIFFHVVRYFHY